jgi:hypothetical protein
MCWAKIFACVVLSPAITFIHYLMLHHMIALEIEYFTLGQIPAGNA